MKKIKKDDIVYIRTGKDKGQTGKVLSVRDHTVIVDGINIRKKAVKGEGITTYFAPVHISNVGYYDSEHNKPVRISFISDKNGKKRTYAGNTASFI